MRKIIVQEFITLDGVIQAPGGPEEDKSSNFKYGGWTAPYFYEADEEAGEFMQKNMEATDLLLGKETYKIFAEYWPKHSDKWPGINDVTKYFVSDNPMELTWVNSEQITGDVVARIKKLKTGDGTMIKVIGSSKLAQTLFKNDLVDELWLMIFPITLGTGKRLFGEGTIPAAFILAESLVTSNGVFFANYKRSGMVKTGTVGA
ncbi:MAG: dihydrofolate reductase family protein [Ignavibacteriaceae bacterium]|jgi:dihydrofolate reductase|nr:dihydrofolate reductase family protein [Ignavibacteriaceae bacterium]